MTLNQNVEQTRVISQSEVNFILERRWWKRGLGCRDRIKKRKRGGGGKRTNVAGVKYTVANHETAGKCITNTAE